MIRTALRSRLAASLIACAAGGGVSEQRRQMGWLAQTVRTIVVFHGCTERLKEKFRIGPLNGIEVTHMDAGDGGPDGAMDVKFEAVTTEKETQRKSPSSASRHPRPRGRDPHRGAPGQASTAATSCAVSPPGKVAG